MDLTFAYPLALVLAVILLAGGLAYWAYRGTSPELAPPMRLLLASLRFAALGLILFLLAQPLLKTTRTTLEQPVIAVLVDASESMGLGGTTNASETAGTALSALRAAPGQPQVRIFEFGSGLSEVEPDISPDSIAFTQGRTDLARAMAQLLDETAESPLSGVLLISDGRYNTGQNPISAADRYPVPVYSVIVGDTLQPRDLQVRRLLTNEIAYRGTELPIEVGIGHSGYPGQAVSVSLLESGRVVDSRQIQLPAVDGETTVTLAATPPAAGLVRYSVAVNRLEGEITFENNSASARVRVLESKHRVLLLAGGPSPDVAAFRRILAENTDIEVDSRTSRGDGRYFEGALPDVSAYDLLVLVGFPGRGTPPQHIQAILAAGQGGTAILFLLDRGTDQRAVATLSGVLPVQPGSLAPTFAEAVFTPTAPGLRHPIIDLSATNQSPPWLGLPPIQIPESRWEAAPGASVLAVAQIRGILLDDPLLAVRKIGNARSAALLGYGFWRWFNVPEDLSEYEASAETVVNQLLRWLLAPEDDRPVRIRPTRTSYEGGERVSFQGQVYDDALAPVSDAAVTVLVRGSDGTELPVTLRSIGNGRYLGDLGPQPEGDYSYQVEATRAGGALGTDQGNFSVGALALESRDTYADAPLMRQIASRTGGRTITSPEAGLMVSQLQAAGNLEPRASVQEARIRLWDRYPFLIVVLLLLTTEWLFRKRSGLV